MNITKPYTYITQEVRHEWHLLLKNGKLAVHYTYCDNTGAWHNAKVKNVYVSVEPWTEITVDEVKHELELCFMHTSVPLFLSYLSPSQDVRYTVTRTDVPLLPSLLMLEVQTHSTSGITTRTLLEMIYWRRDLSVMSPGAPLDSVPLS